MIPYAKIDGQWKKVGNIYQKSQTSWPTDWTKIFPVGDIYHKSNNEWKGHEIQEETLEESMMVLNNNML